MILCDSDNFPKIVIHFGVSSWNRGDYLNFSETMSRLLEKGAQTNNRLKIFVRGDGNLKKNPPFYFWAWVVKDLISWSARFETSLEKTAIFKPTSGMDKFFSFLFSVYTPKRPLKIFDDYYDAMNWLDSSCSEK